MAESLVIAYLMRIIKFTLTPLFLLVAMFCVYGALASTEPTSLPDQNNRWLVVYVVLGLSSFLTAVWLFISGIRQGGKVTDDWET